METIIDYFDRLNEVWYWYWIITCKALGAILSFFSPIVFGVSVETAYPLLNKSNLFTKENIIFLIPPILSLLFWGIGVFLSNFVAFKQNKSQELFNAVKWMCEDIGTRDNDDEDIRCTIWVPASNNNLSKETNTLVQAIDYYPKISKINGLNNFYRNGKKFRTYKVTKKGVPIGILGYTTINCIDGQNPEKVHYEKIYSSTNFLNHMINKWNFTPLQAQRLKNDRKSYACIPLIRQGERKLIGILYIDSKKTNALDKILPNIDEYIIRFAHILTSD